MCAVRVKMFLCVRSTLKITAGTLLHPTWIWCINDIYLMSKAEGGSISLRITLDSTVTASPWHILCNPISNNSSEEAIPVQWSRQIGGKIQYHDPTQRMPHVRNSRVKQFTWQTVRRCGRFDREMEGGGTTSEVDNHLTCWGFTHFQHVLLWLSYWQTHFSSSGQIVAICQSMYVTFIIL